MRWEIKLQRKYLLELLKTDQKFIKKICQNNALIKLWPMKNISENPKPVRVFVYKIIENDCRSEPFAEFIQTQKKYFISLDKISIPIWMLLVISSQNYSCELNSSRTYCLRNIISVPVAFVKITIAKILFLESTLWLTYIPTQFWDFPNISKFTKLVSCSAFGKT